MGKEKLHIYTEKYECSVIKNTVFVDVANFATPKSNRKSKRSGGDQFFYKSLLSCTDITFCGVKTEKNSSSTFAWEKCPFVQFLKKK